MVSQSNGMPPWLTHAFDQQDAAISEVRRNNRANFEAMTRRSATSEDKVREAMAWFDAQRAHYVAAVAIHAAGPEGPKRDHSPPEPHIPPQPSSAGGNRATTDEVPVQRRETTHVHRTRFEVEPHLEQPAPGKANRLMRLPAIYTKTLAIGAAIGGVVWLIVTGLLVWLLGSAWWGWWPSLITVPIAAVALLGWSVTVQKDINHWLKYAGREPLQSRPRFR